MAKNEDVKTEIAFEVTSGKVVWGQFDNIMEGVDSKFLDGCGEKVADDLLGGTIYQVNHQYRAAAKNGIWKRAYFRPTEDVNRSELDDEDLYNHVVLYHEDCTDPEDLLKRALKGVHFSRKPDWSLPYIYVNRYDWGYHHFGQFRALKGDPNGVFLVDEAWAKKLKTKVSKLKRKVTNDDYDDEDDDYDDEDDDEDDDYDDWPFDETEKILKALGARTIPGINRQSEAKKYEMVERVDLLPSDDDEESQDEKIVGVYDTTLKYAEFLIGRLVFDENRNLEAFVFKNY